MKPTASEPEVVFTFAATPPDEALFEALATTIAADILSSAGAQILVREANGSVLTSELSDSEEASPR